MDGLDSLFSRFLGVVDPGIRHAVGQHGATLTGPVAETIINE